MDKPLWNASGLQALRAFEKLKVFPEEESTVMKLIWIYALKSAAGDSSNDITSSCVGREAHNKSGILIGGVEGQTMEEKNEVRIAKRVLVGDTVADGITQWLKVAWI